MSAPSRRRKFWGLAAFALVLVALAPLLFAAELGGLVGGLWVTVMSAVAGLLGGLFGY